MRNKFCFIFSLILLMNGFVSAQFGKNKVQYKNFNYYFLQSQHFDIYFTDGGEKLASFTAVAAESALVSIQKTFRYNINNRISIIVYNSHNDFQQTNVITEYLEEGIGGVTELFKNRIVIPYEGSYKQFRHVIHHELVHAVINDMFYGGTLQSAITNNITLNLPPWFNEGLAEYEALKWDVNSDMFLRDAAINEYLPNIDGLDGYFAYRGGQSIWFFIERKYGKEKIGEILNKLRGSGNFENGFRSSIGLTLEELNEKWKKDQKIYYWPDIATRQDPEEFSKRLTNHVKDGGFYNTSPAISPQGDKIAFISNRDDYFDVFIMSATDGKIIKKLIKGNTTNNFEELHILTPGLAWSPDGKKIALAAKSGKHDAVFIIDVDSEKEQMLDITFLDGIFSVDWSPDGKKIAFMGNKNQQSDIYLFNFENNSLINLTEDIFSDYDPSFSFDSKYIYFSSDRKNIINFDERKSYKTIENHDYSQKDIYRIDINTKEIVRITDLPMSDETAVFASKKSDEILFISDINGINNIYYKNFAESNLDESDFVAIKDEKDMKPLTNSLNGLYQISLSNDNKKLVFSTMFKSGFDIFLMTNPLERKINFETLPPTRYITELKKSPSIDTTITQINKDSENILIKYADSIQIRTGNIIDSTSSYSITSSSGFSNYIFNEKILSEEKKNRDSVFFIKDNRDAEGNFIINKYKINFSPDIIYANAGFSTFYGLLGTTVLAFSDLLGNHQIIGLTSLQIDLKNSDYGLAYYYLAKRIDYGFEGFHTARFLFLTQGGYEYFYRFRNYGANFSMSYPIDKFYRIDGGLGWLNITKDNLDDLSEESEKLSFIIPSISFVHDNSLWGFTSPIRGTRYNITLFGVPSFSKDNFNFFSIQGDYRTYFRFFTDYSLTLRLSTGISTGRNPQKFMIGGTENWINRQFERNEIPIQSAADFLFLTPVLPLRGFNYAQMIGTRFGLFNLELHFPLIKIFQAGLLPIIFKNVQGVGFIDIGSAWNKEKEFRLAVKDENGSTVSRDLLMGTGLGARIYFLYFLLKLDVAWSYNLQGFSKAKFYFSLGTDL